MELESAIIQAIRECQREAIKPTASHIVARLPVTYAYSEVWVKVKLRRMAQKGIILKAPGRMGYRAEMKICRCCGQPITNLAHNIA